MPYSNLNEDRALNETWDGGVGVCGGDEQFGERVLKRLKIRHVKF